MTDKRRIVLSVLKDIARPKFEIGEATRIYEDLLISGDDAFELINRIHERCGTSFANFEFTKYFPDEEESLLSRISLLFKSSGRKSITVKHLINVVEAGAWFEE